jgi:transcriptional regulator with XRE-family HTH domain
MNSEERLLKKLLKPKYRDAFIAANVGVQIATQLHSLRISRGKSQDKLADDMGMNQATISLMEKPEYRKYNIGSLIRFAQHYKIALDVRFVSITEFVKRILDQTSESMSPPSFDEPSAASMPIRPIQETTLTQEPRPLKTPKNVQLDPMPDLLHLSDLIHPTREEAGSGVV